MCNAVCNVDIPFEPKNGTISTLSPSIHPSVRWSIHTSEHAYIYTHTCKHTHIHTLTHPSTYPFIHPIISFPRYVRRPHQCLLVCPPIHLSALPFVNPRVLPILRSSHLCLIHP